MGSFQRFVSLETLYLGRGKCDCRPQMWQSIEDEYAYMAQCSQVGNIGLVKVARRVGVWMEWDRAFSLDREYAYESQGLWRPSWY